VEIFANLIGLLAVVLFVVSYQLKRRRHLILCNALSRVLFVTQYLLLGAYEGALLDVTALAVSLVCNRREQGWIKRHLPLTVALANLAIVAVGLIPYRSPMSLLPILGVIFETSALWPKSERRIRILSLLGAPPWLIYNLYSAAWGVSVGNVITMVSILIAILRYDLIPMIKKKGELHP